MSERFYGGQVDLTELVPYLEATEKLWTRVEALRDLNPNRSNHMTARFFDENQVSGSRPYIGAFSHLSNAVEHSEALWSLVNSSHGLTPRAPWTLLRSIFESGFWASWLLDSPHSLVRRRRGLLLDMADWRERTLWRDSLPTGVVKASKTDARRDVYETECKSIGIDFPKKPSRPDIVGEIPKLDLYARIGDDIAPLVVSAWRNLSGLQHGMPWALHLSSKVEHEIPTVGGYTVTITSNESHLSLIARIAYALVIEGASLYERRCNRSD